MTTTITEAQWQRQVTDLAELLGWSWVHFRPARTTQGWRTPVSGPLGAGWPDLVLVRGGRLIFAELKAARARLTPEQSRVLDLLGQHADEQPNVFVWRPADLDEIHSILR